MPHGRAWVECASASTLLNVVRGHSETINMPLLTKLSAGGCRLLLILAAILLSLAVHLPAAELDPGKLPPPVDKKIDFAQDIKPIFEQSCIKCHGPEKPKSKFRLDNRESALKGGENDRTDIVPGQSAQSRLLYYVAGLVEDMKMPPPGKGEPLTTNQVALLRAWIDQGAPWEIQPPPPRAELTLAPTFGGSDVRGNKQVFREQTWTKDGWNGGAEHFELKERVGEHSTAVVEGHALRDDYRVTLAIDREEVGFARFGGQQYRKYFSDSGGFYPSFTNAVFSLNRDLHIDIGSVWADFGLTLPDWPRMVVGYEYQFKNGEKSLLEWGAVADGEPRNIYPASKKIDERAHILKFDLEHEIRGVRIEDSFRGEWYDSATRRTNVIFTGLVDNLATGFFAGNDIKEGYKHFQGANTFRLEKQVVDWFFVSGGYLYSKLSADATFSLDPVLLPITPPGRFVEQWTTDAIVLERESHVVNLNGLFGPWDGLTIVAGAQSEWTRQKGFGAGAQNLMPSSSGGFPIPFEFTEDSDLDKKSVTEQVGLRYTRIPFTTLFAEARLQQESIGQTEEQLGGIHDFQRQTDATSDLRDFRAGFNTSPWRRISLSCHYRRAEKANHYDHIMDSIPDGYSAFIRSLGRTSDEVETKLVLHPATWLKTTLGFKWMDTVYRSSTDPSGTVSPGGSLQDGRYDAYIYSFNLTLTPFQRLYLSTTFSYQDTRTVTTVNDNPSIVPYRGHIYSALSSGTFAWTEKTDFRLAYAFSHADYGQNNFADGLPLGMVYQRHWLQAGLSRRFLKNLTGNLQYGFSLYDEPSSGGFNNYTAHLLFATLTMNWP